MNDVYDLDYYRNNDVNVARKLIRIQEGAEKRGIHFDLSFAHLKRILSRRTCYYTGKLFSAENKRTIDRVDNNRGYTDDNTVICGHQINMLKNNLPLEDLESLVKRIQQFNKLHR